MLNEVEIKCPNCENEKNFSELSDCFDKENISRTLSCDECNTVFQVKYKLVVDTIEVIANDTKDPVMVANGKMKKAEKDTFRQRLEECCLGNNVYCDYTDEIKPFSVNVNVVMSGSEDGLEKVLMWLILHYSQINVTKLN